MPAGRTLHVRCATWDQVEVFHTRKLRRGKLLSMKVPFHTEVGAPVTLGLELPNQAVMQIEGVVHKASPVEGDAKTWIEIDLIGLTEGVLAQLRSLVADAEAAPTLPGAADDGEPERPPRARTGLPSDERELFQHLTAELRRLRQLTVHDVLGVDDDADADMVRRSWIRLVRKHHPDLVARHHAAAVTHLAEELTILCNRAYDRMRAVLVADGRATAIGSVLQQPAGWLVGFEDISSQDLSAARAARAGQLGNAPIGEPVPAVAPPSVRRASTPPPLSAVQGGEAFEMRARAMLGDGDAGNAQEVLAAALCVYPRSRPLRSLYYVASALAALENRELMLATSQLETALAHHEQCIEAAQILEHVRKHGSSHTEELRRLFR